MDKCSPHKNKTKNYTCFTKDGLLQITKTLKLKYTKKTKKELHDQLTEYYKEICNSEYCWIDKIKLPDTDKTNREIKYYTFKPKIPKGKYELLSNHDINHVLIQYELMFDYIYMGALPSDIFNIKGKIEQLQTAIKQYKYTGIVFNLDERNKPGSHWVSVFINNNKKTIEYFDSVGNRPKESIMNVLNKIKNYKLIINKEEHQRGNTTCGLYAILFIIYKLYNPYKYDYLKYKLEDKKVNPLRQEFFRPLE